MQVLVNGIGNIGTTLVNLLADYKKLLGIRNIYAKKRTLTPWNIADLKILASKGIIICCERDKYQQFIEHFPQVVIYDEIKNDLHYIFETSANKVGNVNKTDYEQLSNLLGVSSQGSEKGFGIPFMTGINQQAIVGQKFVQVVSCNTHASLSVLSTFCNTGLTNLVSCDFVVVRRSEDLDNHQRLVTASVVARHLDENIGTHHAIDALDVLKTVGLAPKLTSSDVTTPSQLLHTFRFHLHLSEVTTYEKIVAQVMNNFQVAYTYKFDSNKVFELGRKYSRYGRLYPQAIFVINNIMVHSNQVMGWAFIPQEGNTILSTLHAFILQTNHPYQYTLFKQLCNDLILKEI